MANYLKPIIKIIFLFFSFTVVAQEEMIRFVDSLEELEPLIIETKKGFKDISEDIYKDIDTTKHTTSQIDLIVDYYYHKPHSTEDYPYPLLKWAIKTSQELEYIKGETDALMKLGDIHRMVYKPNALIYYENAKEIFIETGDREGLMKANSRIALYHYSIGNYELAIKEFFNQIDFYKKSDNKARLGTAYHNVGDSYIRIADTANAIKFLTLSTIESRSVDNPDILAMNANFLGEIYLAKNEIDKAILNLEKSNKLIKERGVVPYLLNYNLNSLGAIEHKLGNFDKALSYYKEAFHNAYLSLSGNRIAIIVTNNLAKFLLEQNQNTEALYILEKIEQKKIIETGMEELADLDLVAFYDNYAQALARNGNFEKAFRYRTLQNEKLEKSTHLRISEKTRELDKKYQLKIDQQEVQSLKDENNLRKRSFIIALLAGIGVLSLLIFSILFSRQRSKRLQQEKLVLDLELENEHIKSSEVEKQQKITALKLELKNKKLATSSMSLLQKKKQYGHIINQLKELKPLVKNNDTAKAKLDAIISDCLASKSNYNWEEFKHTFESVHETFYKNLLKKHPDLTPNEKKLSAFLKLGLNTKDISAITLQNNRTIVIARSRLRKKLGISKDTDLVKYINRF